MKQKVLFILFLIGLSCLSGYLLSKASFIGRTGINLFYKEYRFLKVWWKGASAVGIALLILFILQGIVQHKTTKSVNRLVQSIILLAGIAGLFFTYQDFRNDFSHRLLGERFHIGMYLFWAGSIAISIFYLVTAKREVSDISSFKNAD